MHLCIFVHLPTCNSQRRCPLRGSGGVPGHPQYSFCMIPEASGVYLVDLVYTYNLNVFTAARPDLSLDISIFERRPKVVVSCHVYPKEIVGKL